VDPTPSLLSFGEAITLVRQHLNASSEKAAVVVREALKSGELHIIRDEHVDPISGSQFAIVEEDFSNGLIARWLPRRPRRNLRASQIASGSEDNHKNQ
jgi:hypothetical protein